MAEFDVIGVEYKANLEAYEQGLKDAIAANVKLSASAEKTSEQIQQGINETTIATAKLKAETKDYAAAREEASKKIAKLILEEKQDLAEIKKAMKQAVNPLDIKEYNQRISETEKRIQSLTLKSKELAGGTKTLRSELVRMRDTLARMSETDPGYAKLFMEAAKLEDKIGDVRKAVHAMSSDTVVFDTLAQGAQTLSGAFAAVEGATALLGAENEDLQKSLLRVNAAMSVAFGIQQVAQNLNEKTILGQKIRIGLTKLESVVVGESTGALKAFRIALAATGIGLFVIGLSALIANWEKVKSTLSGVNPETERLAKLTREAAEASREAADNFEEEERRLRALGYTEKEVIAQKQKAIDKAFDQTQQEIFMEQEKLDKLREMHGKLNKGGYAIDKSEQIKAAEDRIATLKKTVVSYDTITREGQQEITKIDEEAEKKRAEENEKANAKRLEEMRRFQQLTIDLMKDGVNKELAQAALNHQLKLDQMKDDHKSMELEEERYYKELSDIRKKHSPETIQIKQLDSVKDIKENLSKEEQKEREKTQAAVDAAIDKTAQKNQKEREDEKKHAEDMRNARIELAQAASDTIFTIAQNRRKAEFDAELSTLNKEREAELANKDLTDAQKAAIEEKYRVREAEIKTEQFKKDKAAAIIKATIDGAIAVISALKTGPIAAGLAAGLAASQIAIIASQPIPQFAKGTDAAPGGFAVVGEKGPEMMYVPKGAMITPADKTKAFSEEIAAMRKGTYSDLITTKYVLPQLKAAHEAKSTAERMAASAALQFDDSEINYNLRKIKPATSKDIARLQEAIIKDRKYDRFLNKTEVNL